MTALAAVSAHLPEKRVPIADVAAPLGLTPMQIKVFQRYHKLAEVRLDPGGSLLDLLRGAVAGLDGLRGQEHRVRYVLHARTFPVVAPYPLDPVRELCREFGLDHARSFAVGHHTCASGLLAVELAGRLLAADRARHPDALALVLAGEKAFTADTRIVPETSFFGEGAAACLVAADGERDRLLAFAADLRGDLNAEATEADLAFQRDSAQLLAEAIRAAVERAGLAVSDIGVILPHNVNITSWRRVCRLLEYPVEQVVLDNVAAYGHVFCADAFINYRTARERGLLRPGVRYVMAAAGGGHGAVFSALVFEH